MMLAPGFVDPHTHYDAQLFWDPTGSPSNLHGVTTVVAGNCGFTLAPLTPGDGDYTRRMMAKVEGMPLKALEEGIEWDWSTFPEYLTRLEGRLGVNAGFLVGHCALRRRVMGPDSVEREATPEEIEQMRALLAERIRAGGLGFSTTLARTHSDGDGKPVASRWAGEDELLSLASVVSEHPGTTLEFASDGCLDGFDDEEVGFMIRFSKAGNRPLNWNVLTIDSHAPERYRNQLAAMDRCAEEGAKVVALTMPVIVGMNMSFLTYCALNMMPDWGPILGLPLEERMDRLRDPETRRFMEDRAASPDAGVFARLTGWDTYVIGDTFSDENDGLTGRRVGDIAAERGQAAFDTLLDIVLADDLRTVLWPGATDADPESWELRRQAGTTLGDARRLRRRCAPGPHAGRQLHDPVHRRLPPRPEAHVGRARGADDDAGARRALRPARPRRDPRGRPCRPGAVRPGRRGLRAVDHGRRSAGWHQPPLRRVGGRAQRVGQRCRDRA
jgi:N-acyl-D-aspartate/D-glutamate deacylase